MRAKHQFFRIDGWTLQSASLTKSGESPRADDYLLPNAAESPSQNPIHQRVLPKSRGPVESCCPRTPLNSSFFRGCCTLPSHQFHFSSRFRNKNRLFLKLFVCKTDSTTLPFRLQQKPGLILQHQTSWVESMSSRCIRHYSPPGLPDRHVWPRRCL